MRYRRLQRAAPVITALLGLGPLLAAPVAAQQTMDTGALTELSFEELMEVEVTSASKRKQALDDVAAALFVISRDDLRRSGANSIPEALRMVPGIQVSQLDANKWAVSARGFAGRFANKLLVLIDGRTVYSPAFSGVYWEQQNVVLDDVERIEVIRGPGATLWGANAVNGVVNIITRDSQKTLGGLALAGAGTENRATATLRYGARLGSGDVADTSARAYLKYERHDDLVTRAGHSADDAWDMAQGGFRLDSDLRSGDQLTLQGDVYRSDLQQQLSLADLAPPDYARRIADTIDARGWNLLGRWQRPLTAASDMSLQLYYDHTRRDEGYIGQQHDTFDLEYQHRSQFAARHQFVWGLGYRNIVTRVDLTPTVTADRDRFNLDFWNAFAQDEIQLWDERLRLTLGIKLEHNDFSGLEYQPTARALWKFNGHSSLWGAVSRAARAPSIMERHSSLYAKTLPPGATAVPLPLPVALVAQGSERFDSEYLVAYEAGWRNRHFERLALDATVYYHDYDELRGSSVQALQIAPDGSHIILPMTFDNNASGHSRGLEINADWLVRDGWRLIGAYSHIDLQIQDNGGLINSGGQTMERNAPENQLSLRSQHNLAEHFSLDFWLRYVDDSASASVAQRTPEKIDAYWDLDLRLAWRVRPGLELELVAQNLLDNARREGDLEALGGASVEVQRAVYASVRLGF